MNKNIRQLSDGMSAAVEAAAASIVQVSGRRRQAASGVVWNADGLIITAAHVLPRKRDPRVLLADGSEHAATIVGWDQSTDLAMLKIEQTGLTPAKWVDSDSLRVGQLVLAVGRPTKSMQATLGIISAVGDSWKTGAGGQIERYIQTDVVMYPGFSGGALINVDGEMVGLNSSALARGVSVTLPPATLKRVAAALLAHGEVKRGYLGIKTQPARLPDGVAKEVGQETGILLAGVEPGGPADKSGLMIGDVIVTFSGRSIKHPDDLLSELAGIVPDQKNPVQVVRGGQLTDLQVAAGMKG